ncbi:MAG: hypothetical protein KDE27_25620 [Planctomycetes bacterium]|nr:hypothetical protein [Planctomycetota bacterium]
MARRSSAARSSRSRTGGSGRLERGPRVRSDGKVEAPCPQCGTRYRVSEDALDEKLECQSCHRVFFPKTTAGKRANKQDYTKVYVGFGIAALLIVVTFALMSSDTEPEVKPKPKVVDTGPQFTIGTHPRTAQVVKWAQAVRSDGQLVLDSHSDLPALATFLGIESSAPSDVFAALRTDARTQWLRDLECTSGSLLSEAMMSSATGTCVVYLVPEPGNKDYRNDDRAELNVQFRMEGDQVKVQSWEIARHIMRLTPDPNRKTIAVNKNIKAAENVEITDSAGTRKVLESEPGPMPHWEKADAALRAKVDEVVAGVLRSVDSDGPPLARFTLKIQSLEDRKAAVPRALNAMYELYGDVNANKMKISQLDRALRDWTGYAVNFQVADSSDPAKDKKERESCVRQWFGFWWRFSESGLEDFFDMRENLEEPLESEKDKDGNKK